MRSLQSNEPSGKGGKAYSPGAFKNGRTVKSHRLLPATLAVLYLRHDAVDLGSEAGGHIESSRLLLLSQSDGEPSDSAAK